jgi:predicted nucleotidyltransferase component of viral defense system
MKQPRNIAASHRALLLALAQRAGEDFQFILGRWITERFLWRLSASDERNNFVLKGAMLFLARDQKLHRQTKDLDLLGFGSPNVAEVEARIRFICALPANDGIVFDLNRIQGQRIREDAEYEGVRVRVPATLDGARVMMQIDVGFGDSVEPPPTMVSFPVLLPLDVPVLRAYPFEAVVAEKLHAMAVLGMANSRMKDFFDVWILASTHTFDMERLVKSVKATFQRRATALPQRSPLALTEDFLQDAEKIRQWSGFLNRIDARDVPSLPVAGALIQGFLMPALLQASHKQSERMIWDPPGPWKTALESRT